MKRLLIAILTIMLLAGPAFAGNKSGNITSDQKAALDGANAPSADNVVATMDDVVAGGGVATVTPGKNMGNSAGQQYQKSTRV